MANRIVHFDIITNPKDIPSYNSREIFFEKIKFTSKDEVEDGTFRCMKINNKREFNKFLMTYLKNSNYEAIYRGQRCYDWYLSSTLERAFFDKVRDNENLQTIEHYNHFKKCHLDNLRFYSRGKIHEENLLIVTNSQRELNEIYERELWAIGQHLDLKTPLLDWTKSMLQALYFAFEKDNKENSYNNYRVVFCFPKEYIEYLNNFVKRNAFFDPFIDPYKRLTAQSGLFSNIDFIDIELLTRRNETTIKEGKLLKIYINDNLRDYILEVLNSMNINYLTTYPDFKGIINYCNDQLNQIVINEHTKIKNIIISG